MSKSMGEGAEVSESGKPVRILHIIVHLTAGGAESMMKRLVLHQHEHEPRFEHRVISLRGKATIGPELERDGIVVEALGLASPLGIVPCMLRLVKAMRRWRPDVVQTWMYHSDLLGGLAARLSGIRAIAWNVRIAQIAPQLGVARRTTWVRRACAFLSRLVPRRIVYVADSARRIHESIGYAPDRGTTIHNGYILPEPQSALDRVRLREAMGADENTLLVASAGRFNPQKNHRSFINAASIVADEFPHARFVLFGQQVDENSGELMRWIEESGHADRFRLMGEKRDFQRWVDAVDLFCLHSLSEGFPNVVAEAMAGGVPCVVTDIGDAAALVGRTGWTVPPNDDRALALAISQALGLDDKTRQQYGHLARQRIESEFALPVVSAQYADLYDELASGILRHDRPSEGTRGI